MFMGLISTLEVYASVSKGIIHQISFNELDASCFSACLLFDCSIDIFLLLFPSSFLFEMRGGVLSSAGFNLRLSNGGESFQSLDPSVLRTTNCDISR